MKSKTKNLNQKLYRLFNFCNIFDLLTSRTLLCHTSITLFRMGGKKVPLTSFSPVTFTNVEIIPQNFPTFIFNSFATLV